MTTSRFQPSPLSYWRELSTPPDPRRYRDGDLTADVVVVGLGAPGLLAASLLAEGGARVIGLDAGSVGRGAAGANGGFLLAGGARFLHDAVDAWGTDRAHRLWSASLEELDRESAELDPALLRLRRCGSLRVAGHPCGGPAAPAADDLEAELLDLERHRVALAAVGVDARLEPYGESMSLFVPGDGWLDPARRVNLLAARARAAGAVLLENEPVDSVSSGVVHAGGREIRASFAIITVDGHLEELFPGLPVTSWRLEMARYQGSSGGRLSVPTYMRWGFDYGFDLDALDTGLGGLGGGFVLGGFRDRSPSSAASGFSGPASPSSEVQSGIDDLASSFAGRPVQASSRWAATVSYTEDLWPMVCETSPGVWVIGGLSGHGNLIGPLAARAVALAVLGGTSGHDVLGWLAR